MPTFAAIPTMYAGVQFRSRLEARWAAFFDLAGWRWEYEPFDLEGYIPDFRVQVLSGLLRIDDWVLAEVKGYEIPFMRAARGEHGRQTSARRIAALEEPYAKLFKCWRDDEHKGMIALLGNSPLVAPMLHYEDDERWIGEYCERTLTSPYTSLGESHWYQDDDYDLRRTLPSDIDRMWKTAGNKVQWKGVQAK